MLTSVSLDSSSATSNQALAIRGLVYALENQHPPPISIEGLATQFGIRPRGLFDFVNICSVFGICRRDPNARLEWCGLQCAASAIDQFRYEVEMAGDSPELIELFDYSLNPSLQRIAHALIKLFFYLNVKSLDIRKVGKIFAHQKTNNKTMLRKLYMVVEALEIVQIVRRTAVVSEIRLNAPLQLIVDSPQLTLGGLLNTPEELMRGQGYEKHRKILEQFL
jgi:hypothetical protein